MTEDLLKVISENLNYLQKKKDVQAIDIALALNVSQSTVSNWLHGRKLPRAGAIQQLADYFNVSKKAILVSIEEREKELSEMLAEIDFETMINSAVKFRGKPITESDRSFIKSMTIAYFDNK